MRSWGGFNLEFARATVAYFGEVAGQGEVCLDESKVVAIQNPLKKSWCVFWAWWVKLKNVAFSGRGSSGQTSVAKLAILNFDGFSDRIDHFKKKKMLQLSCLYSLSYQNKTKEADVRPPQTIQRHSRGLTKISVLNDSVATMLLHCHRMTNQAL